MEDAFGIVVIVVAIGGVLIAAYTLMGSGKVYDEIGKGQYAIDAEKVPSGPEPGTPAGDAERDDELRQMLEARNARREKRGEELLDVDAEISRLTAEAEPPAGDDAALREEVRQMVLSRNARLVRQGKEPLDVEAEVDRQIKAAREV